MKGTGEKRNVCPGSCVSTGAKFPVAPVESAPMDDGPVYHALSVHLSRAKLITRFDDRYAVAKFSKSGV